MTTDNGLPLIGQQPAEQQNEPLRPRPQMPGRRPGASVTISRSNDGTESVDYQDHSKRIPASLYGSSAPAPAPADQPLRFYREGSNTTILGRSAQMHDSVDLGGQIGRTSLGAALHNGWLVEAPGGGFERAGEALDRASGAPQVQQQQDQRSEQEPAQAPREDLLPDDQAYLQSVEQAVGSDLFSNVQEAMIDVEATALSENLVQQVANKLGVDRDMALAHIAQAAAPFQAQAAAKLDVMFGDGAHEEIFAWGQTDPVGKQLLGAAMRQQIQERSTAGYQKLGAAWLAAEVRRDPVRIAQGLSAGGVRTRIEGGQVIVNLPGVGECEIVSALRGGLLRLGR